MTKTLPPSTGFCPRELAPTLYGEGVHAYRIDSGTPKILSWRAVYREKPRTEWLHLIIQGLFARPYLATLGAGPSSVAEAIEHERRRHPEYTIHSWGMWPEHLEFLVRGQPRILCAGVGRIKAAISRRETALVPFTEFAELIWCNENWVIPLQSARQRLQCLNRLRLHMQGCQAA